MRIIISLLFVYSSIFLSAQQASILTQVDTIHANIQGFTNSSFITSEGYIPIADITKIILHEEPVDTQLNKLYTYKIPVEIGELIQVKKIKKSVSGNFYLDANRKLYYEKIYETNLMDSDLNDAIVSKFGKMNFDVNNYPINNSALGYDGFFLPNFVTNAGQYFNVIIQQKDNRYRVIATNFRSRPNYTIELWGVTSSDQGVYPLEELVYKKNGSIRYPKTNRRGFECFSESLNKYFDISVSSDILDEDW